MPADLQRLSVLVVDDSPFLRSLLANALKVLGVGHVSLAEHGGVAIDFLKLVQTDPMRAGVMNVDLVIANWQMSPIDGTMLLRWIRRHKDSPDRFISFLMITAHAELSKVQQARDMGAHEVMTKPFTIRGLGEKVMGLVNKNRQFVHTKDYFGPDRRRQALPFDGTDRRLLTDKSPEVEIIHG